MRSTSLPQVHHPQAAVGTTGSAAAPRASAPPAPGPLTVPARAARGTVPVLAALAAEVLVVLAVVLTTRAAAWDVPGTRDLPVDLVIGATYPLCALLVLAGASAARWVAVVLLTCGLAGATASVSTALAAHGDPGSGWTAWAVQVQSVVWVAGFLPIVSVVPLLYPDGRLPSPRWRPVLAAGLLGTSLLAAGSGLYPEPFAGPALVEKPLSDRAAGQVLFVAGALVLVPQVLTAIAGLVVRWRHATGLRRRQLAVLLVAVAVVALALLAQPVLRWPVTTAVQAVAVALIPVAVTVAVTRHRLYDLDLVLCRAVAGVALACCVAATYVVLVALGGAVLPGRWGGLVAAGLTGLALQPLAAALSRGVDRLYYGDRERPQEVVGRLARRLREDVDPDALPRTVCAAVVESLRLRGARLDLVVDGEARTAAMVGTVDGRPPTGDHRVDLRHRVELVGHLVVAPREGERVLGPRDRELLALLGDQVAPALAALRLTVRLQRSREALVRAREEERRRVRRDLHDGVGAALAGVRLQLEAAQDGVADPTAGRLVQAAADAVAEAVDDIRHVTEDLRPPALDDLGLPACLRQLAARASTPDLVVEAELAELPPLAAAVEVACYRIAAEALANARRHARARSIRLEVHPGPGDAVTVAVADDGVGWPAQVRAGAVGVESMRQRAEELGGSFTVASVPGRTEVRAVLPRRPT